MSPQLWATLTLFRNRVVGEHQINIITFQSQEFLDGLSLSMQVMADRGFIVSEELSRLGVKLVIPTFKGRWRYQMTAAECTSSEDIANGRIHIERAIQ